MRYFLALILTAATTAIGCWLAPGADAKRVSLADAPYAPDFKRTLKPGQSIDRFRQCKGGRYWSDFHAYRADGGRMGEQRWVARLSVYRWRHPRGGFVYFDGIGFENRTRYRVVVAGWCED